MKKVANRIQKVRVFAASKKMRSGDAAAGAPGVGAGTSVSPKGLRPRSAGRSRKSSRARTRATPSRATTIISAARQPSVSDTRAMTGRKASWPVAFDAVNMPMTRPRFCVNQRVATVAPSTIAVMPVPAPTMMPQNRVSCHTLFIPSDRPNPPAISSRAADTTRFRPYLIINAAANGAISPSRTSRTARAPEMSWAVQ